MSSPTVVLHRSRLSRQELHALVMCGWTRCIAKLGRGRFADVIEVTGSGLDRHLKGSLPGLECIDRALDEDDTVLNEWLDAKGKRLVSKEAVCDTDDASLLIARLLVKLQEAQHPDSPGGRNVIHTELLGMEDLIRELHGATGNWLEQISQLRRPRAAA